jgi:two-component system, chemotaxis family, protein-glutamate methylesterase/glutaminase
MTTTEDHRRHLVVVGASAGGIEALTALVGALPPDFPAAVLVVLHLAPAGTSVLPQILARAGALPAEQGLEGTPIQGGRIYVAPPDCHLEVEDGHLAVRRGPTINGHRPAVDALFRSAAEAYGAGVAGVVLSGVLDDGTTGLQLIKQHGGATLVQDPGEAVYDGMPRAAIDAVDPDFVLPAREIGSMLVRLAAAPPPDPPPRAAPAPDGALFLEVERAATDHPRNGRATGLSCPACDGGLWLDDSDGRETFRCRIGHEYSPETFLHDQSRQVERALWIALRAVEERAALHRRVADRLSRRGSTVNAARFARRADDAVQEAFTLRQLLERFAADDESEVA